MTVQNACNKIRTWKYLYIKISYESILKIREYFKIEQKFIKVHCKKMSIIFFLYAEK
jgi:hypothetical protein